MVVPVSEKVEMAVTCIRNNYYKSLKEWHFHINKEHYRSTRITLEDETRKGLW